jgi:lambda family phage minor tail protein L
MSIATEISKLSHHAVIELFEIDMREIDPRTDVSDAQKRVYLHAGMNGLLGSVWWQGQEYRPFPVEFEGFAMTSSGANPRPTMRVSNVFGLVGALVRDVKGLKGAKVIRRRTLAKYLDARNFPGGANPTADPNAHYPDDTWLVDRRGPSDATVVTFELISPTDVAGVQIPRRQVLEKICIWEYRSPDGCGYAGPPVADENDDPVFTMEQDRCSHRLTGCRLRLHNLNQLPFSGFPGCGVLRGE